MRRCLLIVCVILGLAPLLSGGEPARPRISETEAIAWLMNLQDPGPGPSPAPVPTPSPSPTPAPSPDCSDLTIDGPDSVSPGSLVRLEASAGLIHAVRWSAVGAPKDSWQQANDGRTLFFATATPGVYTFTCSACSQGSAGMPPVLVVVQHVVTITGPAPGPQPGPSPSPTPPKPVLPSGKYGLSQLVYDGAAKMPIEQKVNAVFAANTYATVASQIAAGVIRDKNTALKAVQDRNASTLGPIKAIHIAWGEPLSKALSDLEKAGKIASIDDWRIAFTEAAEGLRAWGGS